MSAATRDVLTVTSTTFDDGGPLPISAAHQSVGGDNRSPHLSWSTPPEGTRSVALTCWDPDAPTTVGFCHLILANLPAGTTELPEGALSGEDPPAGGTFGMCDWGSVGYGGMGPPPGDDPHHYQWTVRALDTPHLDVDGTTTYAKFRFLAREHILATGALVGRFGLDAR